MSHTSPIRQDITSKNVSTFRTTWNSSSPDTANINTSHFLGGLSSLTFDGNSSNVVTSESDQCIVEIFFITSLLDKSRRRLFKVVTERGLRIRAIYLCRTKMNILTRLIEMHLCPVRGSKKYIRSFFNLSQLWDN
jgi:hypothetical protein